MLVLELCASTSSAEQCRADPLEVSGGVLERPWLPEPSQDLIFNDFDLILDSILDILVKKCSSRAKMRATWSHFGSLFEFFEEIVDVFLMPVVY